MFATPNQSVFPSPFFSCHTWVAVTVYCFSLPLRDNLTTSRAAPFAEGSCRSREISRAVGNSGPNFNKLLSLFLFVQPLMQGELCIHCIRAITLSSSCENLVSVYLSFFKTDNVMHNNVSSLSRVNDTASQGDVLFLFRVPPLLVPSLNLGVPTHFGQRRATLCLQLYICLAQQRYHPSSISVQSQLSRAGSNICFKCFRHSFGGFRRCFRVLAAANNLQLTILLSKGT